MSLSDENIMEAVAKGQTALLGELYQRYRQPVFGFLWNQTHGNQQLSEDILQDTFERVLKYKHSFRANQHSFKAWIFTIARNALKDRQKRQPKTDELNGFAHPAINANTVTQLLDHEDTQAAIKNAMKQLKPAQREILDLAWKRELKYKEIARITDTTENNVKVKMHRAVKQLKSLLKTTEI